MNFDENKYHIMAGMVLYNSDINRMIECIESLNSQVDLIVIYDNSPHEMEKLLQNTVEDKYKCKYIFPENNIGMPEAMNKIMEIACEEGYPWVLTMNADSIIPEDLITKYSEYFSETDIGMICPQVIDRRRKYMIPDSTKKNEYTHMCITSAACTRVEAWRQVGGFDGWLFVDLLDNDISKRMILNGWKILQVNSVILDQEYGDIRSKSKRVEKFWVNVGKILHNDNFAKFSYKKIVHANRVYYTCRNILYLNKKFKDYGGIGYKDNYNCNTFLGFLICFVLPSFLRAQDKKAVFNAIRTGFRDGKKQKVDAWNATPIKG